MKFSNKEKRNILIEKSKNITANLGSDIYIPKSIYQTKNKPKLL